MHVMSTARAHLFRYQVAILVALLTLIVAAFALVSNRRDPVAVSTVLPPAAVVSSPAPAVAPLSAAPQTERQGDKPAAGVAGDTSSASVGAGAASEPAPSLGVAAGDAGDRLLAAEHERLITRLLQMSPSEAWQLDVDVPTSIAKQERALLTLLGKPAADSAPAARAAWLLAAEHERQITRLQQMSPSEAWQLDVDVPASILKHERALANVLRDLRTDAAAR